MLPRLILTTAALAVLTTFSGSVMGQTPDPLYQESMQHLEKGEYPQAVEKLERLTRLNPKDKAALQALGQAYLMQKQLALAEASLKMAREQNRDDAQTHYWLGILRYQQGDYDKSLSELRTVLYLKHSTPAVYEALARTQRALKLSDEANASIKLGLELPGIQSAQKAGLLFLMAEQSTPKEALTYCDDILALKPPMALKQQVWQLQVETYLKLKDAESVIQHYFTQLEDLVPQKKPELMTQTYAELWRTLARFSQASDYNAFLGVKMDRFYEKHPEEPITRQQLIGFYRKNKELEKVLALYQMDLLSAKPNQRLELIRNIADLHLELNNLQFAYDNYQRVLEVVPEDIHALNRIGLILLGNRDYPEAIKSFDKALKEKPTHDQTRFLLAFAYALNKEATKAEQQLDAMRQKPKAAQESLKLLRMLLDYQLEKSNMTGLMLLLLKEMN